MYQYLLLQDPPKLTQIGSFGLVEEKRFGNMSSGNPGVLKFVVDARKNVQY
jgi:hypothetical protein